MLEGFEDFEDDGYPHISHRGPGSITISSVSR